MLAGKETCVGFDVGKSAHRACAVSRSSGKVLFDVPVDNRADPIDGIPARAGAEALVIVDQKRNIGTLVLERARGGHGRRLPSGPVDEASARHVPRRREDRRDRRRGHRAHRRRDALGAPARRRRGRRGRGDKAARLPEKVPSKVLDPVEEQAALRPAGGRPRLRSSHRPGAGVASGGSCRARREST